jgi:hypothetical protein
MRNPALVSSLRAVVGLLGLLAVSDLHAQAQISGRNLNVMAVNTSGGQIYSVAFAPPGGSTTIGNTDASKYVRPQALAFVTNATTNQLDLLVADNQRGTIYRYPGALSPQTPPNPTTGTLIWPQTPAVPGPVAPNALAVDGYGNLFVTNSTAGHSQAAQLWELPVGSSGPGSFGTPVLLDSFSGKETLLEVTLVPTDVAGATGVAGGDLIVLTTSRVLAYSQASGYTSKITLLTFPNGAPVPGGMDFWPFGNGTGANYNLLISSSSSGTIARYNFTNPLTPAPTPFYSGLGTVYRVKTLFQQGKPLLFVSENGAILEFGANADGTGTLMATVTQNVTTPQGLVVSNSFTNVASLCQQTQGCNLTGLLTHQVTGALPTLKGDIVENVCTVSADPRVTFSSGMWSCSLPYTPPANLHFTCPAGTSPPGCLPVNAVCPGFDDTGKMAIPDSICGKSGASGAGFSLIRTLVTPGQLAGGYVENAAVLADGNNPACGPHDGLGAEDGAFLWGPLLAEGTVQETPNMVEVASGCGSIHGGTAGVSIWGVGLSINEAAAELMFGGGLPRPLENFAQSKYANLTNTINRLTQANPSHPGWSDTVPNIDAGVSLTLWGGNIPPANTGAFGCIDQSWLDFFNATHNDPDGMPQWRADLQNAANLLTNADAAGGTTCDGIVVNAQANNPSAFIQTPNVTYPNGPNVQNPSGQLRSRLANLYYTINTRVLGNAASASWPLPVSVNVIPTSVTLASSSSPGSAMLSWNTNGATGCSLTSSDGTYAGLALTTTQQALTIPATDAGTIVTYTVNCGGPAAATVLAYVNVYPPPTISVTPATTVVGAPPPSPMLAWNTNGAQGCVASSSDMTFTGAKTGSGSMSVSPTAAGPYTYTLTCSNPSTSVSATLTVVAPATVAASAPAILQGGVGATLTWNANGNGGCTWSSDDPAINLTAATSSPTVVNPAAKPTPYSYTLNCTTPLATSSQTVTLSVVQQPTVSLAPATVTQGSSAVLSWNTFATVNPSSWTCAWTSTPAGFVGPPGATGTTTVTPTSAGSFSYTLTCPAPSVPVTVNLTVNAPTAPVISFSPSSITQGQSAMLLWTLYPGDVCNASSNPVNPSFTGMVMSSGPLKVTPAAAGTYVYTLTCTVPVTTTSATLTVTPQLAKIAIAVTGSDFDDVGDRGTLQWTLNGGTSGCHVSGVWPSHSTPQFSPFAVSASGSRSVSFTAAGTYTYTLSCTNPSTPAQTSVVIRPYDGD